MNKITRLLLGKEACDLGESFRASGITGVEVTSNGQGFRVPAEVIQNTKEFKAMKAKMDSYINGCSCGKGNL